MNKEPIKCDTCGHFIAYKELESVHSRINQSKLLTKPAKQNGRQ